jgi:hypothetical protein
MKLEILTATPDPETEFVREIVKLVNARPETEEERREEIGIYGAMLFICLFAHQTPKEDFLRWCGAFLDTIRPVAKAAALAYEHKTPFDPSVMPMVFSPSERATLVLEIKRLLTTYEKFASRAPTVLDESIAAFEKNLGALLGGIDLSMRGKDDYR